MTMKWTAWLMSALMCGAAIGGIAAQPPVVEVENFLESTVPQTFGEWRNVDPKVDEVVKKIYKEVLSRTYVNGAGDRIMLTIARSGNQIGRQQVHLPEICYPSQGFKIEKLPAGELRTTYGPISAQRLMASMRTRYEPVTYWQTMGDHVVHTQWDKRIIQIRTILTGENPGGLLFRVSSIDPESEHAFAVQEAFVADLMASISRDARKKLSGLTSPT
jgi:EpsI family protein